MYTQISQCIPSRCTTGNTWEHFSNMKVCYNSLQYILVLFLAFFFRLTLIFTFILHTLTPFKQCDQSRLRENGDGNCYLRLEVRYLFKHLEIKAFNAPLLHALVIYLHGSREARCKVLQLLRVINMCIFYYNSVRGRHPSCPVVLTSPVPF